MAAGTRRPILCLDFDGVIHSYASGWNGAAFIPDPPVPGAIEFLWEAITLFEVHIFSSRSNQPGGIDAMRTWLAAWDNQYWEKRGDRPAPRTCLVLCVHFPTEKSPAHVSLDDRCLLFTGTWPAMETLKEFKPWNK